MNCLSKISIVLLSCALGACGGGGGDAESAASATTSTAPKDPVDKYVGEWLGLCEVLIEPGVDIFYPIGLARIEELSIRKVNATEYGVTTVKTDFHQAGCAGPVGQRSTKQGAAQLQGTKTAKQGEVDKTIVTTPIGSEKFVVQVVNDRLYATSANRKGIALDAEGYPEAVVTSVFFVRKAN